MPELSTLSSDDEWSEAERYLREERNQASHLVRPAAGEIESRHAEHLQALDRLLAGVKLLGTHRLVVVSDYRVDPLTRRRRARLLRLQGAGRLFDEEEHVVAEELARGEVGLLDGDDAFHRLHPWLLYAECPRCGDRELFTFARLAGGKASYLALATGHEMEREDLGTEWRERVERGLGGGG